MDEEPCSASNMTSTQKISEPTIFKTH